MENDLQGVQPDNLESPLLGLWHYREAKNRQQEYVLELTDGSRFSARYTLLGESVIVNIHIPISEVVFASYTVTLFQRKPLVMNVSGLRSVEVRDKAKVATQEALERLDERLMFGREPKIKFILMIDKLLRDFEEWLNNGHL